MYTDKNYAKGRLNDTIIQCDGKPVLILDFPNKNVLLKMLGTGQELSVSYDSKRLSLQPPLLGYINGVGGATYLVRSPNRRWKQGIDKRGIYCLGPDCRTQDWYLGEQFNKGLSNQYPSLEEAILLVKERLVTTAFNKRWAIGLDERIYYRGKRVGLLRFSTREIVLDEEKLYLREALEEALNE